MEILDDRAPLKIFSAKEPKTFDEQVALIKNKGFIVDDEQECAKFLNKASYHRLSEYFLPFLNADGTCSQNVNFSRIQRIYEFDGKMRSVLLRCSEEIEFYLRTQLAYFSGHNHGALGYLAASTFSDKHDHEQFLKRVRERIEKNKRTSVVRDHMEKYGGKFPIWVIIEFFSMGMLFNFYRSLQIDEQIFLANEMYGASPKHLKSWFECLRNLRNRCAHCSRLYYWIFPWLPKMPSKSIFAADHKLFTQIMTLKYLYPEPEKWNSDPLAEIENLMAEYGKDISLKHVGFPENWTELLRGSTV